jgi:anti-anti-sigma factor
MKITIHELNGITEMFVDGNILPENVDIFRERLFDLVERGKNKIVLNLSDSTYISSLCLSVMINVKNRILATKGDLKLATVNRLIRNLLEITCLVKKMEIYETNEEARNAFEKEM